jgi:hypothetical protein
MRRFRVLSAVACAVLSATLVLAVAGGGAGAASYSPVWLCRPGLQNDPCVTKSLRTGIFSPSRKLERVVTPHGPSDPKVDCFYVYPTVSAEPTALSDLKIQPAETDVALYQAAYYRRVCRMYAPMYHQVTLAGAQDAGALSAADDAEQYASVLDAWNYYLANYNHGRGFVLIGHSQGAFVLRELIADQIDPNPQLRKQMLSAILFGGGVVVKAGSLIGGDFQNIPGCTSATQLGCVVSYSSFSGPPPPGAVFGSSTWSPVDVREPLQPGQAILCTNPAALGGGSALLRSVFPRSFPADAGLGVPREPRGASAPPWFEYTKSYSARCVDSSAGNVLEVTPVNGAPPLISTGALAPVWGLHPLDVNLGLGDTVSLVASESRAYLAAGAGGS